MQKLDRLERLIAGHTPQRPHSRIHTLKSFNTDLANSFVKRDDELGFGISGSKLRKYSSLLPHILSQEKQKVILIGGAYSNHILGLTQLLIENSIEPILFLLGDNSQERQGNLLLTSLLVDAAQLHWISRKDWPRVEMIAADTIKQTSVEALIIPEGALMPAALPGALTLALDICRNEREAPLEFQHIFIEAGSGLSAIALILAYAWLNKSTLIHLLLLADTEIIFLEKLQLFHRVFVQMLGTKLDWQVVLQTFKTYSPTQAKSFGAVNATVLQTVKTIARTEGFFTDPIYSAKLFFEAKTIIQNENLSGNVLIIHSGGGLTLMGFQQQLQKL